jgi:hypothetical protein
MCSGSLCGVCGLISPSSWLFLWFLMCRLAQVLFLSLLVHFELFNSHFPGTTHGLELLSGTCHNKWGVSMVLTEHQ